MADVRRKILKMMQDTLDNGTKREKKELMNKLSTQVLPRLTEITGENGEAINIAISKEASDKLEASVASPVAITGVIPQETINGS